MRNPLSPKNKAFVDQISNVLLALTLSSLALMSCSPNGEQGRDGQHADSQVEEASADFRNAEGDVVGFATLRETGGGVQVGLSISSLPKGEYGVRIHEFGHCEPPGFISAGAPYPPEEEMVAIGGAGRLAMQGRPQRFEVGDDGESNFDFVVSVVTLTSEENSLFHPGGTALVIEEVTPQGTYGKRVACGVISRASDELMAKPPPAGLESGRTSDNLGTAGKKYRQPDTREGVPYSGK